MVTSYTHQALLALLLTPILQTDAHRYRTHRHSHGRRLFKPAFEMATAEAFRPFHESPRGSGLFTSAGPLVDVFQEVMGDVKRGEPLPHVCCVRLILLENSLRIVYLRAARRPQSAAESTCVAGLIGFRLSALKLDYCSCQLPEVVLDWQLHFRGSDQVVMFFALFPHVSTRLCAQTAAKHAFCACLPQENNVPKSAFSCTCVQRRPLHHLRRPSAPSAKVDEHKMNTRSPSCCVMNRGPLSSVARSLHQKWKDEKKRNLRRVRRTSPRRNKYKLSKPPLRSMHNMF